MTRLQNGETDLQIPNGWECRRVCDMGGVLAGKALNVKGVGQLRPYLRTKNVLDGRIALEDVLWMPMTDQEFERFRIASGDVLLNEGQTLELVGRCSLYQGEFGAPCAIQNQLIRFRPYVNTSPEYVSHLFRYCQQSGIFSAIATQTTSVAHLGNSRFSNLRLLWPNKKSEQIAIAKALTDADNLIVDLKRMIAKKQAIKQGMMQQLLTGKTRLPGFTGPWFTTTLGVLGTFLKGRGVKRDDVRSAGIRCLRYGELYTVFHDYTAEAKSFVSPDIAATALPLKTGDLLFAGSGETRDEIGKCVAYVGPIPAVAGGDVIVLRGDQYNSIYLALLANAPEVVSQKARAGQGDAVVHIYTHALAAIEVKLPPRPEQDAIAQMIVDANREIGLLRQRLAKARNVKQGMMQQLLTGRTRLPVQEVAP